MTGLQKLVDAAVTEAQEKFCLLVLRGDRRRDGHERARRLDDPPRAHRRRRGSGPQRGPAPRGELGRSGGDARLPGRGPRRDGLRRPPRARSAPPAPARAPGGRARRSHRSRRPAAHLHSRRARRRARGRARDGALRAPRRWPGRGGGSRSRSLSSSPCSRRWPEGSPTSWRARSSASPTPPIASAAAISAFERTSRAADIGGSPARCATSPSASTAWPSASKRWCAASASSRRDQPRAALAARSCARGARDRARPPPARSRASRGALSRAALDDVEKQLGDVDSILGDLLDVARSGLADLRKENAGCVDVAPGPDRRGAVAAAHRAPAGPDAETLALAFDPPLLARAVHNLFVNARAHGHPRDRPIEAVVTRDGRPGTESSCVTAGRVPRRVRRAGVRALRARRAFARSAERRSRIRARADPRPAHRRGTRGPRLRAKRARPHGRRRRWAPK